MASRSSGSGAGKFIFGLILGLLIIPIAVILYFRFGAPPVATADKSLPFEAQLVNVPLEARISREAPRAAPFGESEDVFEGGARLYRKECASCHGTPGHDVPYGKFMFPHAPQLWAKHKTGNVVGVSDDPVGETYWKVANGIRLTGMPAYGKMLTDTEIWQISILLKSANQPLPDPVNKILTTPAP
ncbi:MAG TPA: cytochrome c [Acidobacteriaceae bacterium]